MFGSEEENKNTLPNSMRVALITTNFANPDLPLKIQERVLKEKNKNLEFIFVDKVNDLFKYKEMKQDDNNKGLMDKNWINKFKNLMPSVIIFYYELLLGVNKEPDEKVIYDILEQICYFTKSSIIFVILISKDMKENPYSFNFNDRQRSYYLRNFLQKDKLYILPSDQIWNYEEFGEICTKIYNSSFQFYKEYHRKYKENRVHSVSREEKIDNDIKLSILSRIKSKKKNFESSKYLDEAYELICDKNFDLKAYKYGSQPVNVRNNFYEIRALGDWVFFKNNIFLYNNNLNKLNIKNNVNINVYLTEINEKIKKCERHIKSFINIKYYDNGVNDYFHFVEYYWLSQRYKKLREFIEDNNTKIKLNKIILFKWYTIIFKEIYNRIKMITFYNKHFNQPEFKLKEIKLSKEKIVNIDEIEEEESNFYGKPPIYSYIDKENKDKENNKEIIGFNDEIYIKKFIIKNQFKYAELIDKFKKENYPQLCQFMAFFKNFLPNNKKGSLSGINLYLDLLKNIGTNTGNIYEVESIEFYNKLINDFRNIIKFPKVYMNLIRQYLNLLQRKLKENDSSDKNLYKKELFINLSKLGNLTKLNQEEENLFYELINDDKFALDKQAIINLNYYTKNNIYIIKPNDLAINFRYDIKDINKSQKRKIFDLIEYELKFSSTLTKEKLKFNSLLLFFEYTKEGKNKNKVSETIIKTFAKEGLTQYELDMSNPVIIPYKVLIKYNDGQISLNKIMFTLCKKENMLYSINIPNEIDKTIFLVGGDVDILKFNYLNNALVSGINQLYKFSYSVNKKKIENIKITGYKHIFSVQKVDEKSLKNHFFGEQTKNDKNKSNEFIITNPKQIPPSIFYFNEEKNNIEEITDNKDLELNYDDFESKLIEGKKQFDILFKFYNEGMYLIKLNIKYIIFHEEVKSDLEFALSKKIYFKVINPISISYNFQSNNFTLKNYIEINNTTIQKKEFLTETPIKMNLVLNNDLRSDIIIKDIQMIPKDNNNIGIDTTLKEIIDSKEIGDEIKEEILKISNGIQYTIPCSLNFKNSYNDSIGKFKILWTTKSLKEYEDTTPLGGDAKFNFLNETEFIIPSIYVRKINYKIDYKYETKDDNVIYLDIKIENKTKVNKRLFIEIGNSDETAFVISGLTNNFINLKNKEIKYLFLKLYVMQNGEIKLPDIIVREVDYEGKEKSRNNFCADKIILN